MNVARITVCVFAALLAACGRVGPRIVATAGNDAVSRDDAAKELRELLWKRGESWDSLDAATKATRRGEAVETAIDKQLIAQFTGTTTKESEALRRARDEDFQQFLKQFPPEEWKPRMELQGLNERTLSARIGAETNGIAAIEAWLAGQAGHVTETDAHAWFDAHRAELVIPQRVHASHIFLTRLENAKTSKDRGPEIKEIHRKLMAKEATFEELAKLSDDDNNKLRGGDLGWFSRRRVPEEFAKAVFALPVGEISEPFESHLGWHIVIVREKLPQRAATFDEMKDEILPMLDQKWREAAVKRLVAELRAKAKIELYPDTIEKMEP